MPNPFYYGGRVAPDQFIGRQAELRRIFAGLEVAHTGQVQSFAVVGPRCIGKSSLLYYVAQRYARYLQMPRRIALCTSNCKTRSATRSRVCSMESSSNWALGNSSATRHRWSSFKTRSAR